MARYDVHRQLDGVLLLNVQADTLDGIKTRVVIPMLPVESAPPARRLNPVISIGGRRMTILTQSLVALPLADLGPVIANIKNHHDEIVAALDMLFSGY
jgi:toxin CcdB